VTSCGWFETRSKNPMFAAFGGVQSKMWLWNERKECSKQGRFRRTICNDFDRNFMTTKMWPERPLLSQATSTLGATEMKGRCRWRCSGKFNNKIPLLRGIPGLATPAGKLESPQVHGFGRDRAEAIARS